MHRGHGGRERGGWRLVGGGVRLGKGWLESQGYVGVVVCFFEFLIFIKKDAKTSFTS